MSGELPTALWSVALGIGLAAACGLRIFVPLLVLSAAALTGKVQLAGSMAWIGTTPALLAFLIATLLEVAAYSVPWLDNVLDWLGAPVAVIAGAVVSASAFRDMDPLLRWALAAIAGGGAAGAVHTSLALTRKASSVSTGGLANPLLAKLELGGAVLVSVVALLLPLLGGLAAVAGVAMLVRYLHRRARPSPV